MGWWGHYYVTDGDDTSLSLLNAGLTCPLKLTDCSVLFLLFQYRLSGWTSFSSWNLVWFYGQNRTAFVCKCCLSLASCSAEARWPCQAQHREREGRKSRNEDRERRAGRQAARQQWCEQSAKAQRLDSLCLADSFCPVRSGWEGDLWWMQRLGPNWGRVWLVLLSALCCVAVTAPWGRT